MAQLKKFDPFDAEPIDDDIFDPSDAEPIKEEPKSKPAQLLESISSFLQEHPKVRELGERFITGTSPEYEDLLSKHGVSKVIGPPTDESLLPRMEHTSNLNELASGQSEESWPSYLGRGAYNLLVRPLGSAEGIIGASNLRGSKVPNILDKETKLLKSAPFHVGEEGRTAQAPLTDEVTKDLTPDATGLKEFKKSLGLKDIELKPTKSEIVNSVKEEVPLAQEFINLKKDGTLSKEITFNDFKTMKADFKPDDAEPIVDKIIPKVDEVADEIPKNIPKLTELENRGDGVLYVAFDRNNPVTPENIQQMFPDTNVKVSEFHSKTFPSGQQRFRIEVLDPEGKINTEIGNQLEDKLGGAFSDINDIIESPQLRPGVIERLKDETGAIGNLKDDKKISKATNDIRQTIINKIISGGPLNLSYIREQASKQGINIKKFNKIVDEIIDTGAASKVASSIPKVINESPVDRLLKTVQANIPLRAEQDLLYSQERGKRIAAFMGVDRSTPEGASKALGMLKGELPKVESSKLAFMSPEDTKILFKTVKDSKQLATWDHPTAIKALFNLINGDTVLQPKELAILDKVFGGNFASQIIELHGGLGSVGVKIGKTANTMKGMMSSVDTSAPLRQGLPLIHRKEYWNSLIPMFKYMKSQDVFDAGMKALVDRPLFSLGRDSGLFLADTGSLVKGEEAFLNSYLHDLSNLGKIGRKFLSYPDKTGKATRSLTQGDETFVNFMDKSGKFLTKPFRASERAYTGFLNKLRADTFDSMIRKAVDLGHKPEDVSGVIARFVNNASGRGSLGRFEKNAQELNTLLFSPRLISSRLNLLTNPKIYTEMPKGMRLDALKSLVAIAGFGTLVSGVGSLAGGKVSSNALSSDFGKVRFGNEVLDQYGGFQQYVVAMNRFLQGKTDSQANGAFAPTRASIAEDFAANKLSPITSLAYTIATARRDNKTGKLENRFGEEISIPKEILDRFTPMFIGDMMDLAKTDPSISKMIGLGIPTALGMGTQTYPERKPANQSKLHLGRF